MCQLIEIVNSEWSVVSGCTMLRAVFEVVGTGVQTNDNRKRFYEVARGSLVEVDAALDIAASLNYFAPLEVQPPGRKTCADLQNPVRTD